MPRILPLQPSDRDAWLDFFDHRAFADHADWSACYCRYFLAGQAVDWEEACARRVNRAPMAEAVAAGQVDGVLAWEDGRVVGWAHVGPAARFVTHAGPTFPGEGPEVGAIVCFLVQADARGKGLAGALLDGALRHLRDQGFSAVVALAARPELAAADQFTGPLALFRAAGFVEGEGMARRIRVRRRLEG
jgi:GNAT superfamily N-acetyltransferase